VSADQVEEDLNKIRSSFGLYRFFLIPVLFTIALWLLLVPTYKAWIVSHTPVLWTEATKSSQKLNPPKLPELRSDAFKLGELFHLFKTTNGQKQQNSILEDASKILKTKLTLTEDQFRGILQEILDFEGHKSI
jgi:hypothetical protein